MADTEQTPLPPQPPTTQDQNQDQQATPRLKVHTNHCRFCNHLLLATTRDLTTLPKRKQPSQDGALILPLPSTSSSSTSASASTAEGKEVQKHYTILLSTTLPDRRATLVRREDGFEKRLFLRCGRCRVVVGYFLDAVHFPEEKGGGEDGEDDEARVVYLLPGGLVETGILGDAEKVRVMDREWNGWMEL